MPRPSAPPSAPPHLPAVVPALPCHPHPVRSHVKELGLIEARAIPQSECFDAALKFAKTEASRVVWCGGEVGGARCSRLLYFCFVWP